MGSVASGGMMTGGGEGTAITSENAVVITQQQANSIFFIIFLLTFSMPSNDNSTPHIIEYTKILIIRLLTVVL